MKTYSARIEIPLELTEKLMVMSDHEPGSLEKFIVHLLSMYVDGAEVLAKERIEKIVVNGGELEGK